MTLVAALDCGTNSLRLFVADLDPATGATVELVRRSEIVRLGQGVDRTGVLAPEALERTREALTGYAAAVRAHGVEPRHTRLVATSATRDASNRSDFEGMVRGALGVAPEVVTGAEEAALAFEGATRGLRGGDLPGPYLVVDIGGGSTELVLGDSAVQAARSVDVGAVRLTERHLHGDPPTPAEIAAATADIEAALDLVHEAVPWEQARTVVVVAGTATTVAALALDLPGYDPARIHLARIGSAQVAAVAHRLLTTTRARIAEIPAVHPKRADVIGAGALVLRTVLSRVGADGCVASESDILDGIAWSIATR